MKTISSIIILLITVQLTFAQSRASKIDSICSALHKKYPEVAMSIGFIDKQEESFFNYGTISRTSQSKANEKTIYPIGSITKLFTANLILQAQSEGKLSVDDVIDGYLPKEFILPKAIQNTIKISDLASHQSGLPNFNFTQLMETNPEQPLDITMETVHTILNAETVLEDYGTYRYSNAGYVFLGLILKNIYGKEFQTLVTEKILTPANMTQTHTSDFNVENKITGYDPIGVEQKLWKWNNLAASAGLLKSNTEDMVKFLKTILYDKNIIADAAKNTEKTYFKNTIRDIGLGTHIQRNATDTYYFKTGSTFSGSSILAYSRDENWGIIIFINEQNLNLMDKLINTIHKNAL